MLRIALKNVMARKGRLLLSALGVIASCTFLSGVFVFGDTIQGSFDRLFANAYDKVDAVVRSSNVIEGDFGDDTRDRIPVELADRIAAVPGVASTEGDVQSFARIATSDGTAIGVDGPPKFGGVFIDGPSSPWALAEGRAAVDGTEVVIDRRSAKDGDIAIGDTVSVTTVIGVRDFTVSGIATFAGNDTSGGATWALFDLDTAMEFVVGSPGLVDSVFVVGDGSVSQEELRTRIAAELDGTDTETLTGAEIIDESQSDIAEGFGFFNTFLTIFAGIATFVGCFIIYNVFKISTAQRLKENALMRAIGARSSQVVRAQLIEAVIIGIVGGLLGFVAGIGLATVIIAGLTAVGFAPSDSALAIQPDSFLWTMLVGIVVTLVCAVFPALRAGRTPPLAAMRDVSVDRSARSRRRLVTAVVAAVAAAVGITMGLSSSSLWLILGVLGLFTAFIAAGPLVVGPLSTALVAPLRTVRGVTGEIAVRNAARSPERTALTAAALGISLALLVGVSTLGSSIVQSFRDTISEQFRGDISVSTSDQNGFGGLPVTLVDEIAALPEIESAVSFGGAPVRIVDGDDTTDTAIVTVNADGAEALLDFPFEGEGFASLDPTSVVVSTDRAERDGYEIGNAIDIQLLDGTAITATVIGIFDSDTLGGIIADRSMFANSTTPRFDVQLLATHRDDVSLGDAEDAVRTVTDRYPTSKTETREQFIDSQISQLGGFLNFIYALLLMSVFIAVLGIVLTLLLAVYERRRELGLVRAVGMTRSQVRSSIRWESVVTALLGAVMGVALGLSLGWIVVRALRDQGLESFSFNPTAVVGFTVMALLFALAAAWWPARKAANADILQAIATN